jgi:hypothetical protein
MTQKRKKPLTSNEVWHVIDNFCANEFERREPMGLCAAFDPMQPSQNFVMASFDVVRMIRATGGEYVINGGPYFWKRPYKRDPEALDQRMMYLAFLLAWVENP